MTNPQSKPKSSAKRDTVSISGEIDAREYGDKQTEKQFQKAVEECAEKLGWLHFHFPNMLLNPSGFPDLLLLKNGEVIFAELKTERGVVSAKQKECLADLRAAGFLATVWRPSDWDQIETILKAFGQQQENVG